MPANGLAGTRSSRDLAELIPVPSKRRSSPSGRPPPQSPDLFTLYAKCRKWGFRFAVRHLDSFASSLLVRFPLR